MLVSSTRNRTSNPGARALFAGFLTAGIALGSMAPAFAQSETPAAAPAAPAAAAQTNPSAATAPAPEGTVDVAKLMAPQALPDIIIGKADAPVTIVEYASMTCSHCRDFHSETYPKIKADYLDTGKAKLILREFPFDPARARRLHAGALRRRRQAHRDGRRPVRPAARMGGRRERLRRASQDRAAGRHDAGPVRRVPQGHRSAGQGRRRPGRRPERVRRQRDADLLRQRRQVCRRSRPTRWRR